MPSSNVANDVDRIFVIGDLNIDQIITGLNLGQVAPVKPVFRIGGTGYNAAVAFKDYGYRPVVLGQVGDDAYGKMLTDDLNEREIESHIQLHASRGTCLCNLIYFSEGSNYRTIFYDSDNANDYDPGYFERVIGEAGVTRRDVFFFTLYLFSQVENPEPVFAQIYELIAATEAKIIIDLVPHDLHKYISGKRFRAIIKERTHGLVGELNTFLRLIDKDADYQKRIEKGDREKITSFFPAKNIECRFGGNGSIDYNTMFCVEEGKVQWIFEPTETGYSKLAVNKQRAFGDQLTASTLDQMLQ